MNQSNRHTHMTITKRTCATCAAFNPKAKGNEPSCANLVNLVIHHVDAQDRPIVIRQQPNAAFWCDDHQTHEEDEAKDAAIGKFWQRLGIAQKGKQ